MKEEIASRISPNGEILKMREVMESDGDISVTGLKGYFYGAFKAAPPLEMNIYKDIIAPKFDNPLLKKWFDTTITLNKEDADRFLSMLSGSAGE